MLVSLTPAHAQKMNNVHWEVCYRPNCITDLYLELDTSKCKANMEEQYFATAKAGKNSSSFAAHIGLVTANN